jgi:hypothetical protein
MTLVHVEHVAHRIVYLAAQLSRRPHTILRDSVRDSMRPYIHDYVHCGLWVCVRSHPRVCIPRPPTQVLSPTDARG